MNVRGISVKVISVTGSFISFKYQSSNSRSRCKREKFMQNMENGIFDVKNPEILGKE